MLCEIEIEIRIVSRPEEYRQSLKRLLQHVRIWPIDPLMAVHYGEIFHELRKCGRVLSHVK